MLCLAEQSLSRHLGLGDRAIGAALGSREASIVTPTMMAAAPKAWIRLKSFTEHEDRTDQYAHYVAVSGCMGRADGSVLDQSYVDHERTAKENRRTSRSAARQRAAPAALTKIPRSSAGNLPYRRQGLFR